MKEVVFGIGVFILMATAIFGPIVFLEKLGKGDTQWIVEKNPETTEERTSVAIEEKNILAHTPATLSGHDQDWDDAIRAAHIAAIETACKSRLYEEINKGGCDWVYTGRIKEAQ